MLYDTIKDATKAWVNGFNAIPPGVIEKLINAESFEPSLDEVTLPTKGDRVYVPRLNIRGRVVQCLQDRSYRIELDDENTIDLIQSLFEVEHDDDLPMWSWMWAFSNYSDNFWLENYGLQIMTDCGFRIYEQEDYKFIFGIDGAGYDFYEQHWIPLYKARGLKWHKEEAG